MSRLRALAGRGLRVGRGWFSRLGIIPPISRVCLVHHPDYARVLSGVPADPLRAERILAFLTDQGLVRPSDVVCPGPASLADLLRVHTVEYLASLERPETLTAIMGVPLSQTEARQALALQRLIVGGTMIAARLALRYRQVAVNLSGGLHHAAPDQGRGFCVFNDIAVAVRRLRARGFDGRILVVDLDLHDGNGTRAAFAADPTVHTYSVHNAPWDERPAVADTSIALGDAVSDEDYLDTLRATLPPVLHAHRPALVIYVAGCDPAATDRLGNWRISPAGLLARDRLVIDLVAPAAHRLPLAVVPGGGYGNAAWRYTARFLGWLLAGRVIEPPDDAEMVLRRFRRIARSTPAAAPSPGAADWSLSEADLLALPGAPDDPRILGRYTIHGIELQLERLGILQQLRALGFRHPTLTVDHGASLGQTLRLYGDPARTELLMELRIRRAREPAPGLETLYVEWLLLQNPRERFAPGRPRLPGQAHPGLGMVREIAGWLVVVCEELGLDGIIFVPSHYYMAALGRRYLRFMRPEDAARFAAFQAAVDGLSLADATRAIDAGQVVDRATGSAIAWTPSPMVLPLGRRLREMVEGPDYERRMERSRREFERVTSGSRAAPAP